MATLAVQTITEAGIVPNFVAAAAGGDRFANGGEDVVVHVKNGGGAPITVTIASNDTTREATGLGPVTKADAGGSVANAAEKIFGPFPRLAFSGADGRVSIAYSAVTSVTVAVYQVPRTR